MQDKPKPPSRFLGKIRAFILAVAAFLLGLGVPAMGISNHSIPLVVSIGFGLMTFAVLTDDMVFDFLKRLKWPRWIRLPAIVLICFIIAGGTYYWSYNSMKSVISKPTLTIPNQQVTTSDNQTAHALNVIFSFDISNVGNSTAYRIRAQELEIDADSVLNNELSKNKIGYGEISIVNPLRSQPPEVVSWTFTVPLTYKNGEGTKMYDMKRLFLYCKISCSDNPNDSDRPHFSEYWYSYDLDRPTTVSMITEEQRSLFEPIVKANFPK